MKNTLKVEPITNCAHCGQATDGSLYCCMACQALDGKFDRVGVSDEYIVLDSPNIRKMYQLQNSAYDFELYVEGLHCASCIHLLEKLPDFEESILEARVDFGKSRLYLKVDSSFSLARIATLLQSWGYRSQFVTSHQTDGDLIQKENRSLLRKLAITGACAGNIMLFIVPVYSGLEGDWKTAFNWFSFILFLPIVFYSGTSFYQGAWNSIRYQTINVDLPITVALLSSFFLSTINLIRGDGAIYFDSTASFIFLILSARYFLKRSQQKFLTSIKRKDFLNDSHFILLKDDREEFIGIDDIKKGNIIQIRHGQVCPVDGIIVSKSAMIDLAVLNGEPLPRCFEKGMNILAGSKILSFLVQIEATSDANSTYVMSLFQEIQNGMWKKNKFVNLTDKCAQWLIGIVFLVAIVFFILYFQTDFQEAFNRSLAVIVLACPCALAFGTPLALNLALKKTQERGILVKNSDSFEKILKVKNVFFDKTGTLTQLNLKVKQTEPEVLRSDIKSIILGLESKSYHPIAFALRDAWGNEHPTFSLFDIKENIGSGVNGFYGETYYSLVQDSQSLECINSIVSFYENNKKIANITFDAPLFCDSRQIVESLSQRGLNCFLISGDRSKAVHRIGNECGIANGNTYSGLSPSKKKEIVETYSNTCMIGDGSNDALAMQIADVGIAVQGSTYLNLQAADVYLTRAGLSPVLELFDIAKSTRKVLVRNISFSLFYNVVGAVLALLGYVDPWLAAILMPVSSVAIVLSTLWGLR